MILLNEAQYQIFNEDIYLNLRQELKAVDKLFDQLLDLVDQDLGLPEKKYTEAEGILKKVRDIFSKMFNADIDLEFDYKRQEVTNIAYTIFTANLFKDFFGAGDKVLADAKEGYSYVKTGYCHVAIEIVALKYFKRVQTGDIEAKGMSSRFNGRHLTAIMVHEIGHNIFLPYSLAFRADLNKYVIQAENGPKLIISDNVLKRNEGLLRKLFVAKVATFLTNIAIGILFSFSFIFNFIIGNGSKIFFLLLMMDTKMVKYMGREAHANNLPLQYGYGQEVLDSTIYIPLIQVNTFYKKSMKKYLDAQKKLPYQTVIVRDLIIMIKDEMKHADTPESKKYLNSLLDFAKNKLRKTHSEMGINNDYENTEVFDKYGN